ncbi:MAG: hypothetical protein WCF26_04760 [Candidatus Sulfotelmatobacter sp.]
MDFLMADPKTKTRYEIEVMLGELDPSHIIRTIEYWDLERQLDRQRGHEFEHCAVIVAEEVTARFFNVIRLLNRAVPIIAIQLSAFQIGDEVVLHFTRVLDTYESGVSSDDLKGGVSSDRSYWAGKSTPESMVVVDSIRGLIHTNKGEPRITYNKYHIALGTGAYNFCWLYPRKGGPPWVRIKLDAEKRQDAIGRLKNAGIEAENHDLSEIYVKLGTKDIQEHRELLSGIIGQAEEWSHR